MNSLNNFIALINYNKYSSIEERIVCSYLYECMYLYNQF